MNTTAYESKNSDATIYTAPDAAILPFSQVVSLWVIL